jgi:hypothetical protein
MMMMRLEACARGFLATGGNCEKARRSANIQQDFKFQHKKKKKCWIVEEERNRVTLRSEPKVLEISSIL